MEILNSLLPLIGIIIGSTLTWLITKHTKRQEWRTEVNKQLIEKRIAAYEEVISITKGAVIGGGEIINGVWCKYPLVLADSENYSNWSANFIFMTGKVSHLIDKDLSNKLGYFKNYLVYLDDYLGNWESNKEESVDSNKLKRVGVIIYEDFQKLTSDILESAGKFYSQTIYNESFEPATIIKEEFTLPEEFKNLVLFEKKQDILHIIYEEQLEE